MSASEILLWIVLPYVAITTFVVGTVWRYRYDKFGWTTRSSQLYERKLIRVASPLFHIGILAVLVGHIVGLLIPEAWTDALGISESMYHFMAVGLEMDNQRLGGNGSAMVATEGDLHGDSIPATRCGINWAKYAPSSS